MRTHTINSQRPVRLAVEVKSREEEEVVKAVKKKCIDLQIALREFVLQALRNELATKEEKRT